MKIMDRLYLNKIYSLSFYLEYVFEGFIDYQQIMILKLLHYR